MKLNTLRISLCLTGLYLLCGCAGVPINEVRNSPTAYEKTSKLQMNDVISCLTTSLDEFRDGRLLITNYQQPPKVEMSIGAFQMGSFKHHYYLVITGAGDGTKVSVKSAGTTYVPLSLPDLISKVKSCI